LNKILITIQGRTLILYYQVKHGSPRDDKSRPVYIQVLPSDELHKFDLKGLTPEMFSVNIADMVNLRGIFSGQVENERQIFVARWALNHEEYLQVLSKPIVGLTHQQIVKLLSPLPGYVGESDNQYIDFEEYLVAHETPHGNLLSGYRLTISTEDIDGQITTGAYYSLDTYSAQGWQGLLPPSSDYDSLRLALAKKLQLIKEIGVTIGELLDETDYALASKLQLE
jgi:hypothetical protein